MKHLLLAVAAYSLTLLSGCAKEEAAADSQAPGATSSQASASLAPTSDPYPLQTCPVSGEALDSMGGAVVHNQPGREVLLCCDSCVSAYDEDAETFNTTIDAEIASLQKPDYPLETCLVSGNVIGASEHMVPYDHVVGNRLYRLCCDSCVKALEKDLPNYRAELVAAGQ